MHAPLYLNAAYFATDPVERMKYVIVTALSFIHPAHIWEKPLNPILGETLQGLYQDGSRVYMEQVTHHPPVSYFSLDGPTIDGVRAYRWNGYAILSATLGMNSATMKQEGYKAVEFADGTYIKYSPLTDVFQNTLMGTLIHYATGTLVFRDEKNDITGTVVIGGFGKKYPKDYFNGEITHKK